MASCAPSWLPDVHVFLLHGLRSSPQLAQNLFLLNGSCPLRDG